MSKTKNLWWLVIWIIVGCGPDTIFLRPGLDTPSQHLANGRALLAQSKYNDAGREFKRALELDPRFVDAYIGLGLTYGHRGEIDKGFQMLREAMGLSRSDAEWEKVENAYTILRRMQKSAAGSPIQQ